MATVIIDGTRYSRHIDVLNGCFCKNYKAFQGAECRLGNGYSVWFPVISRCPTKKSPQVNAAYNGWINLLVNGDTEIRQYWPDPSMAPQQKAAAERRITFAKFGTGNKYWYEFIGVFEKVAAAPDHTTYKRVATQYP